MEQYIYRTMNGYLLITFVLSVFLLSCCQTNQKESDVNDSSGRSGLSDTLLLFNGQDFTGWQHADNSIWSIEAGYLTGSTMDTILEESVWITTEDTYDDFELTMRVKLVGDANKNSGVYYRGQWHDIYVVGYELDIGGWEDEGEIWWGQLHDPYRRENLWIGPEGAALDTVYNEADWNHLRIKAIGNHIQHWVNGIQTVDWHEKDPTMQKRGFIALQMHSESHFMVNFKDIKLIPINR